MLSEKIYDFMSESALWEKQLERCIQSDKFSSDTFDTLYAQISNGSYKTIAEKIAFGKYQFGTPVKVMLAKPGSNKKRVVYCYAELERFYLSLLYQALESLFSGKLAINCFAYRRGISVISAVKSVKQVYDRGEMYGVKIDIHAYFNSVSKEYLYSCIDKLFSADEGITKTIEQLYKTDKVLWHGEEIEEYKSLIPGCAVSSFFANYCLAEIDTMFSQLHIPYARYSDDIIFFGKSAEERQKYLDFLTAELNKRGLELNPNKFEFFDPGESITFLGLTMMGSTIDISKHAFEKLKRTFKRYCRKGRKRIEMQGEPFLKVACEIMHRWNYNLYRAYVMDMSKYGWGYYAFRYINTDKTLKALDIYIKDTIRALKTGRHNKRNMTAVSDAEWSCMHYLSTVEMYQLFNANDFEYYCDVVARM